MSRAARTPSARLLPPRYSNQDIFIMSVSYESSFTDDPTPFTGIIALSPPGTGSWMIIPRFAVYTNALDVDDSEVSREGRIRRLCDQHLNLVVDKNLKHWGWAGAGPAVCDVLVNAEIDQYGVHRSVVPTSPTTSKKTPTCLLQIFQVVALSRCPPPSNSAQRQRT